MDDQRLEEIATRHEDRLCNGEHAFAADAILAAIREALSAQGEELRKVTAERDAFIENRERVRRSFGHVGDGCQCVYCQRDIEGLAVHAADYEMRYHAAAHARDLNQTRAREAEVELQRLREGLHPLLSSIASWSQASQDQMRLVEDGCLAQWRGCIALAHEALRLLASLEKVT